MKPKYKQIQVKYEVWERLRSVVDMLNSTNAEGLPRESVAGLVTRLAEAYEILTEDVIKDNEVSWTTAGVPIIVNGDTAKHYKELKEYDRCFMLAVNNFVRNETMECRFAKVVENGQ